MAHEIKLLAVWNDGKNPERQYDILCEGSDDEPPTPPASARTWCCGTHVKQPHAHGCPNSPDGQEIARLNAEVTSLTNELQMAKGRLVRINEIMRDPYPHKPGKVPHMGA